jgi:Protein of unknown function (DUF1553)/Protein of unknown function (DUF1549)/Planctomycete cytochrome C
MSRSIIGFALLSVLTAGAARGDDPAALEFFEKDVRPLLASRCQKCHGSEKQKGGLRLDSRKTALQGGDNGPAVVPGKPGESLLVEAINYGDLVQMPPKSKLPAAEIATLTKWVEMGAPWTSAAVEASAGSTGKVFNMKERARHWSFQPIRDVSLPEVKNTHWPKTTSDRFLLAALEAKNLAPAADADRRTLIRRVAFDLTGLPPTPDEVEAFVSDPSPRAYDEYVERLLASPKYGERWARHWLDLVRYAETAGHEFDYDIISAWRYRDYLIRAFNADLPYDQLVIEHLAGDLLPNPRRRAGDGSNESILGTGFFALGEGVHSPVDLREEQIHRVDNQIDVLSKTFLGLTVSCARCHDHKFDAISTQDYYSLFGYLRSTRHQLAFIDGPDRITTKVAELEQMRSRARSLLLDRDWAAVSRIAAYFLAAQNLGVGSETVEAKATKCGLDVERLRRWTKAAAQADKDPSHPLNAARARPPRSDAPSESDPEELFEGFRGANYSGWFATGDAFGSGPTRAGDFRLRVDGASVVPTLTPPGVAHSGLVSNRLQGVLRSRTFTLKRRFVHYLASGRQGRINLVIDGFEKNRDPIYGALTFEINEPNQYKWFTQDVSMWIGHPAYIELADGAIADFTSSQTRVVPGDGFLAVDEIRFANAPAPAARPRWGALDGPQRDAENTEARAQAFERAVAELLEKMRANTAGDGSQEAEGVTFIAWLLNEGLIPLRELPADLINRYREVESTIPPPTLAPAVADGSGDDEHVLVRGSYKTPGELAPRRFLEVIAGPDQPAPRTGSGRLELAQRVVSAENPLPARVMVNRLWKHHFGVGLTRSVDDFGAMGEAPSHPDLLDWLARKLIASGWSIKSMQREMVLSRAYRMASTLDPASEAADPQNRLVHRMNVRRLEAEAIRDAMLAVSGRLDPELYGPSVPPHLTAFMDGRGRPGASGPLDGLGRRAIYLNVRRNFLNPMMLGFDYPSPASTMGRRNVSNVPAQALTLLNDPFVLEQAKRWAERLCSAKSQSAEERLNAAYLAAFARPPSESERVVALKFVDQQSAASTGPDDVRGWADLCHVLFNTKEFLFVP